MTTPTTAPVTAGSAADFSQLAAGYVAMWNAKDPAERRTLLEAVCAADVRYTDPLMDVSGLDALHGAIGAVQEQFPDFAFSLLGPVDGHHDQARFAWELGPADIAAPVAAPVAGFDVVTTGDDGKVTRVLGFLDRVPSS